MIGATNPAFNRDHAAAVTPRHVCMAEARNDRCVFAEMVTLDVEGVGGGGVDGQKSLG
jgi:hypothetical protein